MLLWFGGDDESPLGLIGSLAMVLLAPIAATIIQLAISRQREYSADATGADICGNPESLASALLRLEEGAKAMPMHVNQAAEPLYIVKPIHGGFAGLFSTHPPIEERVRAPAADAAHDRVALLLPEAPPPLGPPARPLPHSTNRSRLSTPVILMTRVTCSPPGRNQSLSESSREAISAASSARRPLESMKASPLRSTMIFFASVASAWASARSNSSTVATSISPETATT